MTEREALSQPPDWEEPCYVISVAAKLVDLHPQTLRNYERLGLVKPRRSAGRVRLYSPRDIERLRRISRLTDELGVNLAGVEIILHLTDRLRQMQREVESLRRRLERDAVRGGRAAGPEGRGLVRDRGG